MQSHYCSIFATHLQPVDLPITAIQIWKAQLDSLSTNEIAKLELSLDFSERSRAARFHFEQDRKHYIGSRGLLRHLIGDHLNVDPATLTFEYGTHGKPALTAAFSQNNSLRFNLSHSTGWAMFALASDREVGIDLESHARVRDHQELLGLATRILSERELVVWKGLPNNAAREAAFLRAWTRKEAYAKARGEGLFANLTSVEVILDAVAPNSSVILQSSEKEDLADWIVHDLAAPEGFAAAVAVEHK